jgi:serine protease Do
MNMKKILLNLGFGSLGLVIGLLGMQVFHINGKTVGTGGNPAPKLHVEDSALPRDGKFTTSFAPIIKKAAPSVVNIFTTKNIKDTMDPRLSPFFNDPMFRRFFGGGDDEEEDGGSQQQPQQPQQSRRPRSRQEQSLGSGVIVTEDGYILTNSHVVEGADEVKVVLDSGKEYSAKVIGTDPPSDSAVIKIEAKALPAITIANSDDLQVGDITLAIGNPFGIGQTVTMGIISATGRGDLGIADYEDWIQTDASINPGNSGGALIDAQGRLIGLNSAILSRTGGNQGVGFAVPVNMARGIMERLVRDGKVVRGFLGVLPQTLTPEFKELFKVGDYTGALVADVNEDTPAAAAGIKNGDVITEFNGKKIMDPRHLRLIVSQTPPKTKVPVKIVRDGKEQTVQVTVAELPDRNGPRFGKRGPNGKQAPEDDTLDGVEVSDIDARSRKQYNIPQNIKGGALVTTVDPDSTSYEAGLRPGDVILEMNRKPVENADQAVELSGKVKGPRVLLRVWSHGRIQYLPVDNHKKNTTK